MKTLITLCIIFGCLMLSVEASADSGYLIVSEDKISSEELVSALEEPSQAELSPEELGGIAPAAGNEVNDTPKADFRVIHLQ